MIRKRGILAIVFLCVLCFNVLVGCSEKKETTETTTVQETETLAPEEKTFSERFTVNAFNDNTMFTGVYTEKYDIESGTYMEETGEEVKAVPEDSGITLELGMVLEYTYTYTANVEDPNIQLVSVEVVTETESETTSE